MNIRDMKKFLAGLSAAGLLTAGGMVGVAHGASG